jgi:hypothetical protein
MGIQYLGFARRERHSDEERQKAAQCKPDTDTDGNFRECVRHE